MQQALEERVELEGETGVEAVYHMKQELAQLEFLEKSRYMLRIWGRIQPELALLRHGEDETLVSEWVERELTGMRLVSLSRNATSESYDLKLKFTLRNGLQFNSSFSNRDLDPNEENAMDDEQEEDEEGSEEPREEDEDDDEEAEEEEYDDDEDEEVYYDDDDDAEEDSMPPPPPRGREAKVDYQLQVVDPSTLMPRLLLSLSYTVCTSHATTEIIFFDDLDDDEANEDDEDDDEGMGPMELFYETSGLQSHHKRWLDEPDPIPPLTRERSKPFKLARETCKCVACGVEHVYRIHLNWPLLERLALAGAKPSQLMDDGKRVPANGSGGAFDLIRDLRTLLLLMIISGAGTSGFAFSPLDFLFQAILSDVFDRFTTLGTRSGFEDTIELDDPELEMD